MPHPLVSSAKSFILTGKYEELDQLLQQYPGLVMDNSDNQTLLHFAVGVGKKKIIELLLDYGSNINAIDATGFTPLTSAIFFGIKTELFQFLIDRGASVSIGDPLIEAMGDTNKVKLLFEAGARSGIETVLEDAIKTGNRKLVRYLLEQGVSAANRPYLPLAIHSNSNHHHLEIAKMLIEHGAVVNAKSVSGDYAIFNVIAQLNDNEKLQLEFVNLLMQHEVDLSLTDPFGATPLLLAAKQCKLDIVQPLFEASDKALVDEYGNNALHYAAKNMDTNVCQFLLTQGFNVNAVNSDGDTALHITCRSMALDNIHALLNANADPSIFNIFKKNALNCLRENVFAPLTDRKKFQKCVNDMNALIRKEYYSDNWCSFPFSNHEIPAVKNDYFVSYTKK